MKKFLQILLGLLLLGVLGAGVYFLGRTLWAVQGKLNPNVTAAIVASLAAVAGAIYTQRHSRLREIAESHRAQKVELYEVYMDIIDLVTDLSREGKLGEITDESLPEELEELFKKFRRGVLVWGSPEVIKAYQDFVRSASFGSVAVLQRADGVFSAIRKDLGNSNWGLNQGDLMKLFLKDPAEYDRMTRK